MLRKVKLWIKRRVHGIVTVEELRKNGAVIGNNVELWSNKIDKGHAFLLEIGNNVTISDARILLHDGSTKIFLGYSKVGKVVIGDNVFIAPNCGFYTAGHPLDYEKSKKKCTRFKTTNKKRTNPNSFKLCKNW